MTHEPPMVTGEFRARVTPPPPPPPVPPLPPPGAAIDLLRETVEVQARTIRYLLSNYEALLKKVERGEHKLVVKYSLGAEQTFAANTAIPAGWWVVTAVGSHNVDHDHGGTSVTVTYQQGETLFSDGSAEKTSGAITLAPIETEVVVEQEP